MKNTQYFYKGTNGIDNPYSLLQLSFINQTLFFIHLVIEQCFSANISLINISYKNVNIHFETLIIIHARNSLYSYEFSLLQKEILTKLSLIAKLQRTYLTYLGFYTYYCIIITFVSLDSLSYHFPNLCYFCTYSHRYI